MLQCAAIAKIESSHLYITLLLLVPSYLSSQKITPKIHSTICSKNDHAEITIKCQCLRSDTRKTIRTQKEGLVLHLLEGECHYANLPRLLVREPFLDSHV